MKQIYSGFLVWLYILSQSVAAENKHATNNDFLPALHGNRIDTQALRDLSLSKPDPRYGSWGAIDLCIFSHQGTYQVTVRDELLDGQFQLTSGAYHLPCQVYFNDRPGLSGRRSLREGVALSGLNNRKNSTNCNDSNANLSIEITPDTVLSSQAGHYSARFFLEIAPE